MGDEACLEGSQMLLRPVLPPDWEMVWVNGYDFKSSEAFDAAALGGGTLLSPHGNLGDYALQKAREGNKPYFIFGSGLESVEWDTLPDNQLLDRFVEMTSGASLIGVRGPGSKEYLTRIGLPEERVEIVGDPAVVLEEESPGNVLIARNDGPCIGVNVGTSFGRIYGWDEERMAGQLVYALKDLLADGWNVCLFPIWPRDLSLQQRVAEQLSDAPGLQSLDAIFNPRQLIGLIAKFDSVIAMKLHVGIFAAVAGTPYVPWAYRPKVEDFAAAIAMESYVVRTDADGPAILEAFSRLQRDKDSIRPKLTQGIAKMRESLSDFSRRLAQDLH